MCGRLGLTLSPEAIEELLDAEVPVDLRPRYNIAPSQSLLARRGQAETREVVRLTWGLVPFWAKARKSGHQLINARSETVAEKPAFRQAFARRRCVIPTDGFYEWKTEGRKKQPYHIGFEQGDGFLIAGLWDQWTDGETGEVLETCTLLTTEANALVGQVHHRMPVILDRADRDGWLNPHLPVPPTIFSPYPAEKMVLWPVSPIVNHAGRDEPTCRARQATLL